MHSYIMDKVMIAITNLGNGGAVWIFIGLVLTASKKYRKAGFITLAALILSAILGEGILKHLVQRMRPSANIPQASLLIAKPSSYSFPSGHSAASFAAATVLAKYFRKLRIPVFCFAALIAFSRLYLYVHYPSDVLFGIILGTICGSISIYVFNKKFMMYKDIAITDKQL